MRWVGLVAAVIVCPVAALAQPVFFDDFDGPDLLPHWQAPDPSHWEYDVSGGMLHVTELLFPSVAKLEANFAIMGARYAPQMDFRIDVWMGWEKAPTQPFHDLFLSVNSAAGILAQFGLRGSLGAPPAIVAGTGGSAVSAPPPSPAIHQFTIARTGSQVDFYLDGDPFASLEDPVGIPAEGISLFFSKPFPGEMIPYHIDRISVVPAPGAPMVLAIAATVCARRTRACAEIGGLI